MYSALSISCSLLGEGAGNKNKGQNQAQSSVTNYNSKAQLAQTAPLPFSTSTPSSSNAGGGTRAISLNVIARPKTNAPPVTISNVVPSAISTNRSIYSGSQQPVPSEVGTQRTNSSGPPRWPPTSSNGQNGSNPSSTVTSTFNKQTPHQREETRARSRQGSGSSSYGSRDLGISDEVINRITQEETPMMSQLIKEAPQVASTTNSSSSIPNRYEAKNTLAVGTGVGSSHSSLSSSPIPSPSSTLNSSTGDTKVRKDELRQISCAPQRKLRETFVKEDSLPTLRGTEVDTSGSTWESWRSTRPPTTTSRNTLSGPGSNIPAMSSGPQSFDPNGNGPSISDARRRSRLAKQGEHLGAPETNAEEAKNMFRFDQEITSNSDSRLPLSVNTQLNPGERSLSKENSPSAYASYENPPTDAYQRPRQWTNQRSASLSNTAYSPNPAIYNISNDINVGKNADSMSYAAPPQVPKPKPTSNIPLSNQLNSGTGPTPGPGPIAPKPTVVRQGGHRDRRERHVDQTQQMLSSSQIANQLRGAGLLGNSTNGNQTQAVSSHSMHSPQPASLPVAGSNGQSTRTQPALSTGYVRSQIKYEVDPDEESFVRINANMPRQSSQPGFGSDSSFSDTPNDIYENQYVHPVNKGSAHPPAPAPSQSSPNAFAGYYQSAMPSSGSSLLKSSPLVRSTESSTSSFTSNSHIAQAPNNPNSSYSPNPLYASSGSYEQMPTHEVESLNNTGSSDVAEVSGNQKCVACTQPLTSGAAMYIEDLHCFYHLRCFRCSVCGIELMPEGVLSTTSVRTRGGKLHCLTCFNLYSPTSKSQSNQQAFV